MASPFLVVRLAYPLDSGQPLPLDPSLFLQDYDPLADDSGDIPIGGGVATFTYDLPKALVFPDRHAVRRFMEQVHPKVRTRRDGKPNRLTAYSVEYIPRSEVVPSARGWSRTIERIEAYAEPTIVTYSQLDYLNAVAPNRRLYVTFKKELSGDPRPPNMLLGVKFLQSIITQYRSGDRSAQRLTTQEGRMFDLLELEHIMLLPDDK